MAIHVLSPLVIRSSSTSKNKYTAIIKLYKREDKRRYADSDADCVKEGRRGVAGVEGVCLCESHSSQPKPQSKSQYQEPGSGLGGQGKWPDE